MAEELQISETISIPVSDIELSAVRAQGAGGQNVNKVASAIHLRFDLQNCESLPAYIRSRLMRRKDRRITADGVVIIKAQKYRTQERNRQDALERLADLLQSALVVSKPRKKTKLSSAKKKQRLDNKRKRGQLKKDRQRVDES